MAGVAGPLRQFPGKVTSDVSRSSVPPRVVPSLEDVLAGGARPSSARVGSPVSERPVARDAPVRTGRARGLVMAERMGVAFGTMSCWHEGAVAPDGNRGASRIWLVSQGYVCPAAASMTGEAGPHPPANSSRAPGVAESVQLELADAVHRATVAERVVARRDARIADLLDRLADRNATLQAKDDALDALRVTLQTLRHAAGPRPRVIRATASPPPRTPKPYRPWTSAPQRLWTWLLGNA